MHLLKTKGKGFTTRTTQIFKISGSHLVKEVLFISTKLLNPRLWPGPENSKEYGNFIVFSSSYLTGPID